MKADLRLSVKNYMSNFHRMNSNSLSPWFSRFDLLTRGSLQVALRPQPFRFTFHLTLPRFSCSSESECLS